MQLVAPGVPVAEVIFGYLPRQRDSQHVSAAACLGESSRAHLLTDEFYMEEAIEALQAKEGKSTPKP